MLDLSPSGQAYNRFDNLDSIEDRIIYYILSPYNKSERELKLTHEIWRILYYNDIDALIDDKKHPLPKYSDITKLIYNDQGPQTSHRVFRSPRLDNAWNEECSLIKIYVDSIIPLNALKCVTNVGIDVITHSKIINVLVPEDEINVMIDKVNGVKVDVQTKSRVTLLAKNILALLNGADVAGVGKMVFSRQLSIQNLAQYGLWNHRSFEGMKLVMGVTTSGVS